MKKCKGCGRDLHPNFRGIACSKRCEERVDFEQELAQQETATTIDIWEGSTEIHISEDDLPF